jgi:hypothetical protein
MQEMKVTGKHTNYYVFFVKECLLQLSLSQANVP